jgi:ribosomal protein S18 acetylase RimI-like enzyme
MIVRRAVSADRAQLAGLLEEMERHYSSDSPRRAADALAALLVAAPENGPHTLVAEAGDGALLGFAICNEVHPARRLSKGLYLKDIFVSAAGRSAGTGRRLLDHVAALAKELGCTRVNWTTNVTNTGAQKLYDAIGARREAKVNYVLEDALLEEMARRADAKGPRGD